MPAVITFEFDPLAYIGDTSVRLQTIVLAIAILAALLLVARIARRTPVEGPYVPPLTLQPAELPFLLLGVIPGAVLGGRLDYVLVHLDYYVAHIGFILDPSQGALGLGLAIPGAIIGGVFMAELMGTDTDRWMHAATMPTVLLLVAGKASSLLAGEGQGQPSDLPWATAFRGEGPWSSLAAWVPSHPSQAYEAIVMIGPVILIGLGLRSGVFARRNGSALLVAVGMWALTRALVAFTWRDPGVLGPIRAEQLIMVLVAAGALATAIRLRGR